MSSQELVDALHPHLSRAGATEEVPWSVVGRPFGPSAGGKVLPLRGLWEAVQSFGGAEAATTNKKWSAVARELGQDPNSSTHIASTVKSSYMRYLFAYECFRTGKALPDAAQGEEPPLMLNS